MGGLFFTIISQTSTIQKLPVLLQNFMSIFTVLPMAIAVIVLASIIPLMFQNSFIKLCGKYSYEIYLVHAFSLMLVKDRFDTVVLFMIITSLSALILKKVFDSVNKKNSFRV